MTLQDRIKYVNTRINLANDALGAAERDKAHAINEADHKIGALKLEISAFARELNYLEKQNDA